MIEIAQTGLLSIFILTIIFHLLVLIKVVPYSIVWGGRLKSDSDMYKFEIVSLILNVFFLFVILLKSSYLNINVHQDILTGILWVMAILFLINSIANLFSKDKLEKIIFTPITVVMTILTLIICLNVKF